MNTSKHRRYTMSGILFAALLLLPDSTIANERQRCLNNCTQAGATKQQQCKTDYDAEMIRCGQLQSNQERNACKRLANETLKQCNSAARDEVKQCQANCPAKNTQRVPL